MSVSTGGDYSILTSRHPLEPVTPTPCVGTNGAGDIMAAVATATATQAAPAHRVPNRPNLVSVGTIVWLASELMFFAALFAIYFTLRSVVGNDGPNGFRANAGHLNVPLSIANTLILSVLERTREIGLLRALGMTRSQTRSMVRWESVIISLLGAVLGLSVGLGLGVAVSGSLHDLGITEIAVPGTNLILYAIIAGVFGVVAAIFPTIRASRVDILRAITTE